MLSWRDRVSAKDEKFLRGLKAKGEDVPLLATKPKLTLSQQFPWIAYSELTASRQIGFGAPQPIQITEIEAWLRIHEITDQSLKRFIYECVIALDTEYLTKWVERNETKPNANPESRN